MDTFEIVTTAERPELVAVAAEWIWREWARPKGRALERVVARMAARRAACGPEQTFVLLDRGQPAATASLVHEDLDARPDLTPWLASVFVHPDFRGRGHAPRLVRAVEASCVAAGVATLYLNSNTAVPLYARLGWREIGEAPSGAETVTLMRRDLDTGGGSVS
jgi:GNAT superfamily N-acetyltransferase